MAEKTVAEIAAERRKAQLTRSERELARIEAESKAKPKPKAKPKAKLKEKKGVGRSLTAETEAARVKALKAKLDAARRSGNKTFEAKIEAQLAEIRKAK